MIRAAKTPEGNLLVLCPGCFRLHEINLTSITDFTGCYTDPTINKPLFFEGDLRGRPTVCHSLITNGNITFFKNSTHCLKGQTVSLLNVEKPRRF